MCQRNPRPHEAHVPWRRFLDYGREFELCDARRRMVNGRAATRGDAMAAFRAAFDDILHGRAADRA
jgi:hypothetical protein